MRACAPLSACGSGLWSKGWRRRCCPRPRSGSMRASSMASGRPTSSPWPAPRRRRAKGAGPYGSCRTDGGTSACGCPVPPDGAPGAQKNELKPHLRRMWCIPPKQSAEFVDHMEDVLEVYCRPDDPKRPVVCLDETFRQLVGEVREPLPPAPGRVERYDCMYVRNGTASLFLAFEPLAGWRDVAVTDSRKRGDWARFVKALVEERYRDAEKVILVMDPLNTH